ncbi:hypothetical protein C7H09_14545 [Marinobacter fuscus]|uniref:Uncharacterized protein n=1 Tax=Marinobacter fuscus TaxID=2109942 RepID=A0A2T1K5S8_9GAMM|nr:hypothetical protein C7H09_14545 [Marinobacter fuscus]
MKSMSPFCLHRHAGKRSKKLSYGNKGVKMEARVGIEPAYTELQDELSEPLFLFNSRHLKNLPHIQFTLIRAL